MHLVTTLEMYMYIIVGTHADIVQECWLIVFDKICENKVWFDFVFYTQYTFKSLEQAILKLFKILPFLKFLYQLSTFQYYFLNVIGPGFFPLQILIIKLDIQIRRINVSVRYNFCRFCLYMYKYMHHLCTKKVSAGIFDQIRFVLF